MHVETSPGRREAVPESSHRPGAADLIRNEQRPHFGGEVERVQVVKRTCEWGKGGKSLLLLCTHDIYDCELWNVDCSDSA